METNSPKKYSINYNLEFINTKEEALKAFKVSTIIWQVAILISALSLFVINGEKISFKFPINSYICIALILVNYLILTHKFFLIFYINKAQRFNEKKKNKVLIFFSLFMLVVFSFFSIAHSVSTPSEVARGLITNLVIIGVIAIGFIRQSKIIKKSLENQIERLEKHKKERLIKYHQSLYTVNLLPIILNIITCFIIVTSNALTQIDVIILFLFNLFTLMCAKPEKRFFLQYCPKCFHLRSLGLSAFPYCPNCKREDFINEKDENEDGKQEQNKVDKKEDSENDKKTKDKKEDNIEKNLDKNS